MREHRVGSQRHGAAVGFDGRERLIVAQRGVAACEERPVVALPRRRLVGDGGGDRGECQDDDDDDRAFQNGCILPAGRNFRL
ncbi:MAG: hypothetical protein AUI11_03710 [Acidobacteria bacterium 13_2_20CM_2_66_4]|nr:MAG: hypothetical protein AUI11_03710 [Acidobacteria bacterium 13_2_20CM_2_66_4]